MNRHLYAIQQEKNYLTHHGIKGQKWGIRRYQNPDGTLTEKGKTRYNRAIKKALEKNLKLSKFGTWQTDESKYTEQISKDIDELVRNKSDLIKKGKKFNELSSKLKEEDEKFWDSKECKKIFKRIEKEFENEYGRKPIKNGHNYNIDDIELMNFDDEELIEARSKWHNNSSYKKLSEKCEKAFDEYYKECEKLTNYLVSKEFKNVKLADASGSTIPFDREIFKRIKRSGGINV